MIRIRGYNSFLLFLMLLLSFNIKAQYNSEDDIKKAAADFFNDKNFTESTPLYGQLLSLYPKDPKYNFKYGASLLMSGDDKEKPLRFLKFACSKSNINPLAYFYLGKAYHLNYQFSAAEANYLKFKSKATSKEHADYLIDMHINMARNGSNLLKNISDIIVVDKKEIKRSDFFRSYNLRGIGGKVVVKPDDFKTKVDKKLNEYSLIYLSSDNKMVIFSSYGNDGKNGKDLFKVVKLPNGEWSKPSILPSTINTKYDEDYPFLHPDGKTLYFSSKGHNSMGGYDIFKSEFNEKTNTWSTPINLDFAINSPDDDILFISDIDNELAYFASARSSKQDKINVYNVRVEKRPTENSVIKGTFIAESNPNMKKAKITILDAEKDKNYGVYNTDNVSGDYLLLFPGNGGKFKILIETSDQSPVHSAIIDIPKLEEFRPLKQELILVGEGENEKLVVKNLFDEVDEFDITNPLVIKELLKEKAKLDINTTKTELEQLLANNSTNKENTSSTQPSDEEVINAINQLKNVIKEKYSKAEQTTNSLYTIAKDKINEAKSLIVQANKEKENGNEAQGKELMINAQKLINEADAANNLARSVENEAIEKNTDLALITSIEKNINESISNNDNAGKEKYYNQFLELKNANKSTEDAIITEQKILTNKADKLEEKYEESDSRVTELLNSKIEIEKDIAAAKIKKQNTKKKKEIANLDSQIAAWQIDLEDIDYQLVQAKKKRDNDEIAFLEIKNELNSTNKVLNQLDNNLNVSSVANEDKVNLTNDLAYFEEKGLVGVIQDNSIEENQTEFVLANEHQNYSIVDENGKVENYSTNYGNELANTDTIQDEYQKQLAVANIQQKWIKDIEEEISIRKKQATINDDLQAKTRLEELKTLKEYKNEELNNTLILAESINPDKENQSPENPTNITNTNGEIVNYEEDYNDKLNKLDANDETIEILNQKVDLHKEWVNAIEQEILIRKMELAEASDEKNKEQLNNAIDVLTKNKNDKQDLVALYTAKKKLKEEELLLASTNENSNEENNVINNNNSDTISNNNETLTNNNEEIAENNTSANTEDITTPLNTIESNDTLTENSTLNFAFDSEIFDNNGELINYENELSEEINDANAISNLSERNNAKAAISKQLVSNYNDEIKYQNSRLNNTINEEEIAAINDRINYLSNQVESTNSNIEAYTVAAKKAKEKEENLLALANSPEDDFSNLKYNNAFEYESNQATVEINKARNLKKEAAKLDEEAEILRNSTLNLNTEEEKTEALAQANQIEKESENKQIQVAKIYGRANRNEYENNRAKIGRMENDVDNQYSTQANIASLLADEADFFFEKALESRDKAALANSFSSKEIELQKAYDYEIKAIEKQNKAIETYKSLGAEEGNQLIATNTSETENNNTTSTNTTNNNSNNFSAIDTNQTSTTNNTIKETTENNNKEVNTNQIVNNGINYEPRYIYKKSDTEVNKGKRLEKQAELYEARALALKDSSNTIRKKKERQAVVANADTLKAKASRMRKEAQVYYEKAKELNEFETALENDLQNLRKELREEKIEKEDETIVNSLSTEELNNTINSTDYKVYAENKKNERRLVKEAQIEYIKSDSIAEEAENEDKLLLTLEMFYDGEKDDARKEKLKAQIAELKSRIEIHNTKAEELRIKATNKEKEALQRNINSKEILKSLNQTDASLITAVERTSTYNPDQLSNAKLLASNSSVENNTENDNEYLNLNSENDENSSNTEDIEIAENNESITPENEIEENNVVENESTNKDEIVENNTLTNIENINIVNNVEENESIEELGNNIENEIEDNNTTENIDISEVNELSNNNNDVIPTVLTTSIFNKTPANKAVYSNTNPIPIEPKMPEGLVFKVQIGAFRNPIPQDHFKGFSPIMGEKTSSGLTRYTAGLFKEFNVANSAKTEIRSIGYQDAFVVAYLNGKRISINEARAMIQDGTTTTNEESNELAINTESDTNTNPENLSEETTTDESSNTSNNVDETFETEEVNDGVSTDVRNIEGIFFTVQVGVYSKPVSAGQLNNVTPLNSERTTNGYIRYTSGVFNTLEEANKAKSTIRDKGITDAYVTAYKNGKRVSISEAQSSNNPVQVTLPQNASNNNKDTLTQDTDNLTINEINDVNIEFKVKLGEYEEEVPVEDAAIFLKLIGRGVKSTVNGSKTMYTIGSYPDYQSAVNTQMEMKELGANKAEIIAYNNNKLISVEKALELLK